MAQLHMGHVVIGWRGTPDQIELLPTVHAEAAARIAQHSSFMR
jgi:hypothetical protein